MSYRQELGKLVKSDPFWGDNPEILITSDRAIEFVPTNDMNRVEKINALARLFIYIGALLCMIYMSTVYIYIPIIGLAFLYFVNMNFPEQESQQQGGRCDNCDVDANGNSYQKPSENNPFMNVLVTDYVENPNRSPAADIEDPKIRDDIKKMFENGLYKDVDDIWDRNNSQRQYYTNPATTIPNDRDSFMNWCWNVPSVCKDGDLNHCLKREDVRAHGQIV